MSFWDNVKKFAQPYGDDDYDEYDDDEVDGYEEEEEYEAAPRASRRASSDNSSNVDFGSFSAAPAATPAASSSTSSVSGFTGTVLGGSSAGKQEVVLFRPTSFGDSSKPADDLRARKAVVVNMENVDQALARRVVDFLTGCAYALDGKVKKIAQSTYLFCPHNMEVIGDLENLQSEVESYI